MSQPPIWVRRTLEHFGEIAGSHPQELALPESFFDGLSPDESALESADRRPRVRSDPEGFLAIDGRYGIRLLQALDDSAEASGGNLVGICRLR